MTRPVRFPRKRPVGEFLLLIMLASGCSLATGCGPEPARLTNRTQRLEVLPASASLPPGGSATFVVVGAVTPAVQWTASAGSITSSGFYTAPSALGSYQIQATSGGLTGSATATVVPMGSPPSLYAAATSACASMPLRSTGTIYYFCDCKTGAEAGCVAGNDANAGTSPSAPKRRWWTATQTFNAMNAGDTVALCRGGAWNLDTGIGTCGSSDPGATHDAGTAYLQNTRCAAGASLTDPANTSTCDIRDYAPTWGGTNKPLLAIPSSVTGPTTILGRNGAGTNGVRIMNLEFKGNNRGPRGGTYNDNTGLYWGSCGPTTDADWLVCNNTFSYFAIALHMEENGSTAARMNITGNRVTMSWLDGLLSGPGSNSKIDANFWDNNGCWGSPMGPAHTMYPNGLTGSGVTTNAQIINNEIRYSAATCDEAIISGHNAWNGLNVENNIIDCGANPISGCWAVKLDSGNGSGAGPHFQRNLHMHRNLVYASSVGLSAGQAPGAVIENNVIVMIGGTSDWKRGILMPSEPAHGFDNTSNVTVRNNTIYMPMDDGNGAAVELGWTGEVETGHVLANNTVYTGGSSSTCFVTPLPASGYSFVGTNACYRGTWGTSYDATTHVTADPMFVNAPDDFTPAAGSLLIGAGTAARAPTTDFALRTRANPPAIGAYEP